MRINNGVNNYWYQSVLILLRFVQWTVLAADMFRSIEHTTGSDVEERERSSGQE